LEKKLTECNLGHRVKVVAIQAGKEATLNLNQMGIHVGDEINIIRKTSFHHPLIIEIHQNELAIGYGLAQKIIVSSEE